MSVQSHPFKTSSMPLGRVRWHMAMGLGITLFVGYLDRMSVSLGMPLIAQYYGWSMEETRSQGGWLMTTFYVGYGIANLFLSGWATRIGPRTTLLVMVVLWSVFTALGAWLSASLMALVATRCLLGLSEGVHFPMMNVLTQRWFPMHERARANSVWMAGLLLAVCLAPVLMVPLMQALGWRTGFLVLAVAGVVVSLPVVWLCVHDHPGVHPAVTLAEKQHIEQGNLLAGEPNVPPALDADQTLWQVMTRPNMLLALLAGVLYNITAVGLSSWLPTYFVANKGLPYADLIYAASLPYAVGILGLALWSWLGDRFQLRAGVAAIGFFIGAVGLWLALDASSLSACIVGFCLAVFSICAFSASEFAIVQRLLPAHHMGAGVGIYNGLSTLVGGGLGPVVVSSLIGGAPEGQAHGVHAAMVVCLLCSALLLVMMRRLRY